MRSGDMETDYSSDVYIMATSRTCGGASSGSTSSSFISKSSVQCVSMVNVKVALHCRPGTRE